MSKNPHAAAIAPAGTPNAGAVYVSNSFDGMVSVIRPDGKVGAAISVGKEAHKIAAVSRAERVAVAPQVPTVVAPEIRASPVVVGHAAPSKPGKPDTRGSGQTRS